MGDQRGHPGILSLPSTETPGHLITSRGLQLQLKGACFVNTEGNFWRLIRWRKKKQKRVSSLLFSSLGKRKSVPSRTHVIHLQNRRVWHPRTLLLVALVPKSCRSCSFAFVALPSSRLLLWRAGEECVCGFGRERREGGEEEKGWASPLWRTWPQASQAVQKQSWKWFPCWLFLL